MPKQGFLSCSYLDKIMVTSDLKKGVDFFGAGAITLAYQIAASRLGVDMPEASGIALDWGNEYEWAAKHKYTEWAFREIKEAPFIESFAIKWFGGTPDGLLGMNGIIEIKCPYNPVNHLKNVVNAYQYEEDYKAQIQGYLLLTGYNWCDFVSYDPRFTEPLDLSITRIERDESYIETLETRIKLFLQLVEQLILTIKK